MFKVIVTAIPVKTLLRSGGGKFSESIVSGIQCISGWYSVKNGINQASAKHSLLIFTEFLCFFLCFFQYPNRQPFKRRNLPLCITLTQVQLRRKRIAHREKVKSLFQCGNFLFVSTLWQMKIFTKFPTTSYKVLATLMFLMTTSIYNEIILYSCQLITRSQQLTVQLKFRQQTYIYIQKALFHVFVPATTVPYCSRHQKKVYNWRKTENSKSGRVLK